MSRQSPRFLHPRRIATAPEPPSRSATSRGSLWPLALAATLAAFSGCSALSPHQALSPSSLVGAEFVAVDSQPRETLLDRAQRQRRAARSAEKQASDTAVDHYYHAAVLASAASRSTPLGSPDQEQAQCLAADCLLGSLRAGQATGRLDARSRLLVNGPAGAFEVPIVHRGFVWQPNDFDLVVDPAQIPRNPNEHVRQVREGVGAPVVVVSRNERQIAEDRFLRDEIPFPATALLKPDLDAWLTPAHASTPADVIELYDPMRVALVDTPQGTAPLAANFDAPWAAANTILNERGPFRYAGFVLPSTTLAKSTLAFHEPYQPGKIPVVFVHGLLDDPQIFGDMVAALRLQPGFTDHYQVGFFRYPTGISFLRSASILREELRLAEATFDPTRSDPGFQNMVLVGYSMGGLITKLQISHSGDALWKLAATRPLDTVVTPEASREALRKVFYFEPLPFVRRAVFIATPHGGSALAGELVGRFGSSLVRTPDDTKQLVEQLDRDNPGLLRPVLRDPPTSIDLLRQSSPFLELIRILPRDPRVTCHTIAGYGRLPERLGRGDKVVPLESAYLPGVVSELHVPAVHTNIYRNPQTIAEVSRILEEHASTRGIMNP